MGRACILLVLTACTHAPSRTDAWARVLSRHVHDGVVDYQGLRSDRADLDHFLDEVARRQPRFADADDRKGFFIDVYNACVLALVRDHAVRSILDLGDPFTRPTCKVAGRMRSLDELEQHELRSTGDARVHMALVCASRGCPPLQSQPFRARGLGARLDRAARSSLVSTRIDATRRTLYVSHMFASDWLGPDFVRQAGSVAGWLRRNGPAELARALDAGFAIDFLDWDWSLNEAGPASPVGFVAARRAAELLGAVTVLDARLRQFSLGHVPGSQPIDWKDLLADDTQAAARLAGVGVDAERPVLVYGEAAAGDGGEGFIAWRLVTLGHSRVYLIDGGWPAWHGPIEQGAPSPPRPGQFPARPDPRERAALGSPIDEAVVLDVRSDEEWAQRPQAGAQHLAWTELLDQGRLPTLTELTRRLARVHLPPTLPIVTVCTGGVRSAFAWAILRASGMQVRNLDGGFDRR
jgi:3-mercaptopyruvate sulfurtransferase SseA